MTEQYVELHAASAFSFLEGASEPELLVKRALELDMPAMALLDRNGVYGAARFHTSAKRNHIRPHIGAEVSVSCLGPRLKPQAWLPHRHRTEPARLPLLCESREGYQNLCQLITQFKMQEKTKGEGAATLDDIRQYASGLVCLTGGDEGPLAAVSVNGGEEAGRNAMEQLIEIFGRDNVYVEVSAASRARRRMAQSNCTQHCARTQVADTRHERYTIRYPIRPRNSRCFHIHSSSH